MPWWSWRPGSSGGDRPEAGGEVALQSSVRVGVPAQRDPGHSAPPAELSTIDEGDQVQPVTLTRIGKALDLLDIRFLADGGGSLLAMWERHAVLFTLEGPDDEILVMRARPHSTVPPDWADRAYRVVNEWNHTRRFCKAYVGDPTERGQLPIYAELQVPLNSGAHDALLVEMLDCGAAVATSFVDWLHDEGALL
ncbi:YbjN domain-containing protein [Actinoplanes sp. NPDC051470]|uniref:YbjN domain-containing protein n=1 Tax=unclassified Actinoplanes TaxID=2626549 RepID=UPI003431EBED